MKKIVLFRHESWIKAGHFTDQLNQFNLPFEWIAIDQGDAIPENISQEMGGLVFLGGTMSVNDSFPWINEELQLICKAHAARLPVLGFCFGSQLISKALGGEVSPMPHKEIGWHKIDFEKAPSAKEWLNDVPEETKIMIWHHEQFSIPQGASSLYTSTYCKNQAFVIGNTLAVVAHIELSAEMLEEWLGIYGDDIEENGGSVQSRESIRTDVLNKMQKMHQLSNPFFLKWLSLIYPEKITGLNNYNN